MKQLLHTYSVSGHVVTLTGVNRPQEAILSITDATTGAILYTAQTGGASAYTQATNSTITLSTAPSGSDALQIFYDDGVADAPPSAVTNYAQESGGILSTISTAIASIYTKLMGSVAVTGTFWQATQPVSGTVSVAGTVPVSGSFYQTTQPVSNAGTFDVQPSGGDLTSGSQTSKIVNGANTLAVDANGAVTTNNRSVTTQTLTTSGAISAGGTIGSVITVGSVRQISVNWAAWGSSGNPGYVQVFLSNDQTNWGNAILYTTPGGVIGSNQNLTNSSMSFPTNGFAYAKITASYAVTSGTTALVIGLSQQISMPTVSSISSSSAVLTTNIPYPQTNYGFASFHSLVCASSTNSTLVKNSSATIGTLFVTNTTASLKWLRLFNKSTSPSVGTDTPVWNIALPPNWAGPVCMNFAGDRFITGLAYAITGGAASAAVTDSTAVAAGDVVVNMTYA